MFYSGIVYLELHCYDFQNMAIIKMVFQSQSAKGIQSVLFLRCGIDHLYCNALIHSNEIKTLYFVLLYNVSKGLSYITTNNQ